MRTISTIVAAVVITLLTSHTMDVWADGYYRTGQDDIQSIAYDVLWPIPDWAAGRIYDAYIATGHTADGNTDLCTAEPWHTMVKVSQLGFDPDC